MANPQNSAVVPLTLSSARFSPKMTFFQRFRNTLGLVANLAVWYSLFVPANQGIMREYFGDEVSPLLDIYKNASLLLTNTHPAVSGGRPLPPTVIDIGGVHIRPPKKLSSDIEKFIEESPHGVIYFCMGSLLRAATLPEDKKYAFLHTFSQLKERILWKFEEEEMLVPGNVMIKKWMPQRDILAHPSVKLFISHGGLLGILETVHEGKPILGIPMFGDQGTNIRTLEEQGVAKLLDYNTISNETVYEAVRQMLEPQYAKKATELSRLFRDQPMSPKDRAVYWIEYVIRHNGARNLRSPAVDLPYYQYLLLDVIFFFVFSFISCIFVTYYLIKILRISCRKSDSQIARTKLKPQ